MGLDSERTRYLLPPCPRGNNAVFEGCIQRVPYSRWCGSGVRRSIDVTIALLGLAVCALPMAFLACLIRLTSPGPALIHQQRVGRYGKLFRLAKFRSMSQANDADPGLTVHGDSRLSPLGCFLRRFKLDELPQLFNVLAGQMSLVGPRPKLPRFAEIPNMPYRPGLTGLASIVFRSEHRILGNIPPERVECFYQERIKPVKAGLDVCYMCRATPASDAAVIAATALGWLPTSWILRLFGQGTECGWDSAGAAGRTNLAPAPLLPNEELEACSGCER
jgi:lipopolysaccharide/colanic/teichoic acid biosynthesis glycosyltransferase